MPYSLQVLPDNDGGKTFRWVILKQDEHEALLFEEHSFAEEDFDRWADALNAGTVALARAEGQPYENEAADPVQESSPDEGE